MSEWALTNRHKEEDIFGVQICGSWPDEMTKVAELMGTFCDVDFIDINCGCPLDLICNHGSGCKLAKNPDRLGYVIKGNFFCHEIGYKTSRVAINFSFLKALLLFPHNL